MIHQEEQQLVIICDAMYNDQSSSVCLNQAEESTKELLNNARSNGVGHLYKYRPTGAIRMPNQGLITETIYSTQANQEIERENLYWPKSVPLGSANIVYICSCALKTTIERACKFDAIVWHSGSFISLLY